MSLQLLGGIHAELLPIQDVILVAHMSFRPKREVDRQVKVGHTSLFVANTLDAMVHIMDEEHIMAITSASMAVTMQEEVPMEIVEYMLEELTLSLGILKRCFDSNLVDFVSLIFKKIIIINFLIKFH